jgi:hypothetical protein
MESERKSAYAGSMLEAIPGAKDLLSAVRAALGPERLPLLIGIDGRWGAGKSSLACWLGWQLGMPAISLDLYVVRDTNPLEWRYEDLGRVIQAKLRLRRPLIVEGICLCRALHAIDHDPDFLVWLENKSGPVPRPGELTEAYVWEFQPEENADFRVTWGTS